MKTHPEAFVIETDENPILYNPLDGKALKVSPGVISLLQDVERGNKVERMEVYDQLVKTGFIVRDDFRVFMDRSQTEFAPTGLTLLPTWDCNLGCLYCYSRGGERIGKTLGWDVAKEAIDLIVKNAIKTGEKETHLRFHGGGEPLLKQNMPLVKRSGEYYKKEAEKHGLKSNLSVATNGVLGQGNLEFMASFFDQVNISFDGLPEIQDLQRPTRYGGKSSPSVLKTIAHLEKQKTSYGIRSTVTSRSVHRLSDMVEYISENTSLDRVHFESLYECGRCSSTGIRAPEPETFVEEMIKVKEIGKERGIEIFNSGSNIGKINDIFCGAAGYNFFVTPEGDVTACLEVSRKDDDAAEIFFIGSYNPDSRRFEFNEERISRLRKRTIENMEGCSDCYAKFNCAGDCLAKSYISTGELTSPGTRCYVNRALILHDITEKLKNEE